jgi:crotonobetainyl-CoA:carnitine CoA-transferase CaiB-like acyl-CoA transferase
VVDLSRLIVGALASRHLADLGAEVVKIEDPVRGDYLRAIPPFVDGVGVWHELLNRNKKSVALDITDPEDRDTVVRLIEASDVVVEVSRPGSLERLGVDLLDLRRRHPRLIVCSISGFGQTGELAHLPAHGFNMDSLAGLVETTANGNGEQDFVRLAYTSFGNEFGAANAGIAVCAALAGVARGGTGAWIDISCWDALVELNRCAIAYLTATGRPVDVDNAHMWGALHRLYHSRDGKLVFVAMIEKKFWDRFCEGVGRLDLRDRWHGKGGVDYGDMELTQEIAPIIASKNADEWSQFFIDWSISGSPILELPEVLAQPHFATRGLLELNDERLPNVMSPVRFIDFGGARPGSRPEPAPKVGSDTESIMRSWLGESPKVP